MNYIKIIGLLFLFSLSASGMAQICSNNICESGETMDNCSRDCWLDSIQLFLTKGGRVDWSKDGSNLIAFDQKDTTGFYDIYTINSNGTGLNCITCGIIGLPQKHNGNPAWSPNGEWIVFQAENEHVDTTVTSEGATPGKGGRSNLWSYNTISGNFAQLTFLADSNQYGVLHPHFSHDGTKLSWTEKYEVGGAIPFGQLFGVWRLKTADFIVNSGTPSLVNITNHQPYDAVFYENHGFSKNDSCLLFTSNIKLWTIPLGNNNINLLNLTTNSTLQLTDSTYNEHAQFTVDGQKIVWGTSRVNANNGMDYWVMDADGTNKKRLSYFNDNTQYEFITEGYAVDMSFSSDGNYMISYVQTNLTTQEGRIYLFSFNNPTTGLNTLAKYDDEPIIYPNPSNGNFTIELPISTEHTEVVIHNVLGDIVFQKNYMNQSEIQISFEGISGIYYLETKSEQNSHSMCKLVKL